MTAPRNPDAIIAAFLRDTSAELPDRAFDAVRRDIHRTRQLVVLGPFREPDSVQLGRFAMATAAVVAIGIAFVSTIYIGPGPSPSPSPTAAPSPTDAPARTAPSGPTAFSSPLYGYTVTVPAGWISAPALLRWDGVRQSGPDAETDKFDGPEQLTAWAYAGPFSGDLADLVTDRIAANFRDHADTCPVETPEVNEPIQVGGQAGVLLGWNCGALINQAHVLRGGVAYMFVFRDLAIEAATDPADLALFQSILDSVEFPS